VTVGSPDERSDIRERSVYCNLTIGIPHFAALNAGYGL
jgi:hypothetical protein